MLAQCCAYTEKENQDTGLAGKRLAWISDFFFCFSQIGVLSYLAAWPDCFAGGSEEGRASSFTRDTGVSSLPPLLDVGSCFNLPVVLRRYGGW